MAISIVKNINPIISAGGAFIKKELQFKSSTSLTNRVLNLDIAFYGANTFVLVPGTAYSIMYPFAAGTYEMQGIRKNWKVEIQIIDSYNFIIKHSFFITRNYGGFLSKNKINGSTAFDIEDEINSSIYYNLESVDRTKSNRPVERGGYALPVKISPTCEKSFEFTLRNDDLDLIEGYTTNEDLTIDFKINESVNNTYYIGIYREDAIADVDDIVSGIGLQYGFVNGGAIQTVDVDIPKVVFSEIKGFKTIAGESYSYTKINGAYLKPNGTYRLLLVYQIGGAWFSCLSPQIIEFYQKKTIGPLISIGITDSFGNFGVSPCAHGLLKNREIKICAQVNKASYETKLDQLKIGGTYDSRIYKVNAFLSKYQLSRSGEYLSVTTGTNTYCVNYKHDSNDTYAFVTFEFIFQMDGYKDRVYKVVELKYEETIETITPIITNPIGDPTKIICDEESGLYTITNLPTNCVHKVSVNKGSYQANSVLSGNKINSTKMNIGDEICITSSCGGTLEVTPPIDPDTTKCEKVSYKMKVYTNKQTNQVYTFVYTTGGASTQSIQVNGDLSNQEFLSETPFLVLYEDSRGVIKYEIETVITKIDCIQIPLIARSNWASFNYTINEDTQTANFSYFLANSSPLESEEYLMSFDGINFIPGSSSVTGEDKIYLLYKANFTDNSPSIQIEQVIEVPKKVTCNNSRSIQLSEVSGELIINITSAITSTKTTDDLYVSLDDGETYEHFDLLGTGYTPIKLNGGEIVRAHTYTAFLKDCADLEIEATLTIKENITNNSCDTAYAPYQLSIDHDDETGIFTATFAGNRSALEIDDARWTVDRGNPFDVNNTGIPYSGPVAGSGLFILRWKLKLPNCPTKYIDAFLNGHRKTIIKIPPIDIKLPSDPIQFCQVSCCAPGSTIECVNRVLTITGASLTGVTITWTGPNGFTATGNGVTIPDVNGNYIATLVGSSCSSNLTYNYVKPNAGEPIDSIIIVS